MPLLLLLLLLLTCRLLKMLDFLGLCSSVLINVMLMRRLGIVGLSGWSWHHVPTIAYFTAGIVQLAVLLLAPAQHQRHRFAVNLANRLVKAVTVTWAVSGSDDKPGGLTGKHVTGTQALLWRQQQPLHHTQTAPVPSRHQYTR
jgi:hypothetical protein